MLGACRYRSAAYALTVAPESAEDSAGRGRRWQGPPLWMLWGLIACYSRRVSAGHGCAMNQTWTEDQLAGESAQLAPCRANRLRSRAPCRWSDSGHTTPRKTGRRRKPTSDIPAGQAACAQVARRR